MEAHIYSRLQIPLREKISELTFWPDGLGLRVLVRRFRRHWVGLLFLLNMLLERRCLLLLV